MISKEFIPLKAKNWVEKIQMYGAMCQGMEGLSIKKYVEDGRTREINLDAADSYFMAIKRVTGKLQKIYPLFWQWVKFIQLEPAEGEHPADIARRLDKLAELAELNLIKPEEIILMKFCAMCSDKELRQKICKLEDQSWGSVKDCIRRYEMARGMDKQFSIPKKLESCTASVVGTGGPKGAEAGTGTRRRKGKGPAGNATKRPTILRTLAQRENLEGL